MFMNRWITHAQLVPPPPLSLSPQLHLGTPGPLPPAPEAALVPSQLPMQPLPDTRVTLGPGSSKVRDSAYSCHTQQLERM